MRHGILLTASAEDPRELADAAAEAEAAGWDGVFTWDGIAVGEGMTIHDPWVTMAAMAMRTERVRIGAILTPPARRRPWKLARETISLDRLSNGRLILPVGLGATDDAGFGNVGEPTDARTRAGRLDESLEILAGLWSGEPYAHEGTHYRFGPMTFRPTPVQRPRIPIWVAAAWPRERSVQRALRYDGMLVQVHDESGRSREVTPDDVRAIAEHATRERAALGATTPWDIVVEGTTPADDPAAAAAEAQRWADAGATWRLESDWSADGLAAVRRRIEAGPPRR
jgi:alkanesulfonate monooxygenase SsuD/methylene tetrahydromethanopterin reductase-like flavin-dependent oxidoreductase (luciferase family)